MKSQNSTPLPSVIPSLDINASLKVDSSVPEVTESALDLKNKRLFIAGMVVASTILVTTTIFVFIVTK